MGRELKILQCGLGPIGQAIARRTLETPGLKLVGASDVSTEFVDRDLGSVLGLARRLRLKVAADPLKLARKTRPDVAVIAASSSLKELKPLLVGLLGRGIHVVTTCEELAFPAPSQAAVARELDRVARRKKAALLGTGINPGFVMDTLPLMLTAPCVSVERVAVTRVIDVAQRRLSLQRKVGAGLTPTQFRLAEREGSVRQVGLQHSALMIAGSLGWKLDRVDETLEPVIAPRDLETPHLRIPAGNVSGIKQVLRGWRRDSLALSLDLQVYVAAENPRDHVQIDGQPPLDVRIPGGIEGDTATVGLVLNALPGLLAAGPGLLTMRDLPLVHLLVPGSLAKSAKRR